jgi:hypothetical protein
MFDGRDTIVIFEKLADEDLLPVRWSALPERMSDVQAQHLADRNLRVLQACDALEEHGQLEKSDEESPHSADLMRLDFKLNLLLELQLHPIISVSVCQLIQQIRGLFWNPLLLLHQQILTL